MRGALSLACGRIGNAEQQHERVVADGEKCPDKEHLVAWQPVVQVQKRPLARARGSVVSVRYGAATARERFYRGLLAFTKRARRRRSLQNRVVNDPFLASLVCRASEA